MADVFTPVFQSLYSKFSDQERIKGVPRTKEVPSSEYLIKSVMPRGYPLVFTNSGVVARSEDEILGILRDNCAELTLQVRRAKFEFPGQYTNDRQLRNVTMAEYLNEVLHGVAYAGNQQLPPEIATFLNVIAPHLGDEAIEAPTFWFGAKDCVTPLHKDSTDNFAYQICGAKRWMLFPVRDIPFLYMDRPIEHSDYSTSCVDPKNPFTGDFPLFAKAHAVVVDLHAGEMLYLPAGWAHHVENLSTSLMVNFWMSQEFFARSMV